jgi:hypothetical protein
MTNASIEQYTATRKRFATDAPGIDPDRLDEILRMLHRHESTLHRIADKFCSVRMTERENRMTKEKQQRTEDKVRELAGELGFKVEFNDDPRGKAIRFILPSGEYNNWDGRTWGINW